MARANGIVFVLDPRRTADLRTHLGARDARALTAEGCDLTLVCDALRHPCELHAILSWELAVPLKVERLGLALMAAGGELRRDLDPDLLRARALTAGHELVRVRSVRDLDVLSPVRFAPGARPIGLRAFSSAA